MLQQTSEAEGMTVQLVDNYRFKNKLLYSHHWQWAWASAHHLQHLGGQLEFLWLVAALLLEWPLVFM